MDSFWGWTKTNSGNFFAVCVRKPIYGRSVSRRTAAAVVVVVVVAAGNWRRQMVKLSPVFSSLTFSAGPFCFGVGKGGRVVVCDGSFARAHQVRRMCNCESAGHYFLTRLISVSSSLSPSANCEVCVCVCLCRCVCVHPPLLGSNYTEIKDRR